MWINKERRAENKEGGDAGMRGPRSCEFVASSASAFAGPSVRASPLEWTPEIGLLCTAAAGFASTLAACLAATGGCGDVEVFATPLEDVATSVG